ncbi:bacteriocin [Plesiomonas shigelloides]|uniref:Bacteriocin n=1 Tax=Plesiomonas shigelloides TaxID=703 RepID=A0A8I1WBB1_PLESH|nr:bacteriocin [Plesiomonas shigelloides]MBO1109580.1 bacteriocin [Plesiomonas shigelloides]
MGYGLIDIGAQTRNQAMGGLREAARLEQQRENMNKELKAQKKQATMSGIGTGAGMGFLAGGPIGALIGGGLGFLSSLF